MGVLTGPQRKSTEHSQYTVVCFFGIIKSSPSGIHSGAGGIIQLGLVVVHFVRHLNYGQYFFPKFNRVLCLFVGFDGGKSSSVL